MKGLQEEGEELQKWVLPVLVRVVVVAAEAEVVEAI